MWVGTPRATLLWSDDDQEEVDEVLDCIVDAGSAFLRRPVDIRAIDADVDGSDCGLLAERVPQPTACGQRRISRRPVPV